MESTGIMQQVQEALEAGNSSGEVIKMGFAPSTVYKVQRNLRRIIAKAPVHLYQETLQPSTAIVEKLLYYQSENEQLHQRIEALESIEKENQHSRSELNNMKTDLQYFKAKTGHLSDKLAQQMEENRLLQDRLQAMRLENINLANYLSSKDCGWRLDFQAYSEYRQHPPKGDCRLVY